MFNIKCNKKNKFNNGLIVLMLMCLSACSLTKVEELSIVNQLTDAEVQDNWQLLFDGETSGQWRGYKQTTFPNNWQVSDGTLNIKNKASKRAVSEWIDIVFPQQYENFILKLDWKISEKGNSGIFYLANEQLEQYPYIWQTAPEMQILDNHGHKDANKGKNGNRQAGSLYDLIPAKPQNANPIGEWNQVEIIVNNRQIIHKQNGVIVVQYSMDTPEWNDMISNSKFPTYNPDWSQVANKGLIGLQDHGDKVWFRNIKIKPL